jgi:hypothetical protein
MQRPLKQKKKVCKKCDVKQGLRVQLQTYPSDFSMAQSALLSIRIIRDEQRRQY